MSYPLFILLPLPFMLRAQVPLSRFQNATQPPLPDISFFFFFWHETPNLEAFPGELFRRPLTMFLSVTSEEVLKRDVLHTAFSTARNAAFPSAVAALRFLLFWATGHFQTWKTKNFDLIAERLWRCQATICPLWSSACIKCKTDWLMNQPMS